MSCEVSELEGEGGRDGRGNGAKGRNGCVCKSVCVVIYLDVVVCDMRQSVWGERAFVCRYFERDRQR